MINESTGTSLQNEWSTPFRAFDASQITTVSEEFPTDTSDLIESLHANIETLENLGGKLSFVLKEIRTVMKV